MLGSWWTWWTLLGVSICSVSLCRLAADSKKFPCSSKGHLYTCVSVAFDSCLAGVMPRCRIPQPQSTTIILSPPSSENPFPTFSSPPSLVPIYSMHRILSIVADRMSLGCDQTLVVLKVMVARGLTIQYRQCKRRWWRMAVGGCSTQYVDSLAHLIM